jgi:hypothetical protein
VAERTRPVSPAREKYDVSHLNAPLPPVALKLMR